jgi:hypothetical protein
MLGAQARYEAEGLRVGPEPGCRRRPSGGSPPQRRPWRVTCSSPVGCIPQPRGARVRLRRSCSATCGNGPAHPIRRTPAPAAGGRARRIQRQVHVQSTQCARRLVSDLKRPYQRQPPQFLLPPVTLEDARFPTGAGRPLILPIKEGGRTNDLNGVRWALTVDQGVEMLIGVVRRAQGQCEHDPADDRAEQCGCDEHPHHAGHARRP